MPFSRRADRAAAAQSQLRPSTVNPSSPSPSVNAASTDADGSLAPSQTNETAKSASPGSSRPPSPTTSSRPKLLSRISLPLSLRSRKRNMADFYIKCDEPYKKYSAGDHVRGSVIMPVVKPFRFTHLVVALHGYIRVLSSPSALAKTPSGLAQSGSSDVPRYHGNGFASLFQDEQVLSGEGRMERMQYEFRFDLMFPEKGLPSSIDFERGSISYLITATLTRPTSIGPVSTCDRKVVLIQSVDIGQLPPPRPRTIFLEPISKRTRRKKSFGVDKASVTSPDTDIASETGSAEPSIGTDESTRDASGETRNSGTADAQSEFSGESQRSVATAVSRTEVAQAIALPSPHKQKVVNDKTITATIELLRAGCLPGDTVPVKVTVQHIKRLKSMTGVIVTLFRQGKTDTSPPPSSFDSPLSHDMKLSDKEDIYPKSRTGLAGLSLSSTSSTNMFRKDLDQNMAPLIIDPMTLQASLTISVKIPENAFPTIKGVPGEMISFKYQIEVIVDLGGKISNQFSSVPSSRGISTSGGEANGNIYTSRRGTQIADTAQLRREKGVISVSVETVVGTTDSSQQRRRKASPTARASENSDQELDDDGIHPDMGYPDDSAYANPPTDGQAITGQNPASPLYQPSRAPAISILEPHSAQALATSPRPTYAQAQANGHGDAAPGYIPAPQVPDQANLNEKDRIRQAETRLLPSQPPGAESSQSAAPSAPLEPEEDNLYDAGNETPRAPQVNGFESSEPALGPSAPPEEDVSEPTGTEDKQELERRRLLAEASAPPEMPEDSQARQAPSIARHDSAAAEAGPSAPALDDDDEDDHYVGGNFGEGSSRRGHQRSDMEQLPAYER